MMPKIIRALLLSAAVVSSHAFAQGSTATDDLFKMIDLDRPREVRALLLKGVKPDVVDVRGDSALVVASRSGQLPIVQTLVESGAKVNLRNKWGDSALMVAALNGQESVVRYLRGKGGDVNSTGWTALHYAAVNGHADVAKYLLDQGANPVLALSFAEQLLVSQGRTSRTSS